MLGIAAVLFVSSAWAMIFTAMTAARSSGWSYTYDYPAGVVSHVAPSCGFSMEIFPVSYIDQNGQLATAWKTEVRNCYGGTTPAIEFEQFPRTDAVRFRFHYTELKVSNLNLSPDSALKRLGFRLAVI
jgi:hypothetical protein